MDYRLRLDGALYDLWEPLWRLPIRLFHEEKELMRSKAVRRLHYVRHGGRLYQLSPYIQSTTALICTYSTF